MRHAAKYDVRLQQQSQFSSLYIFLRVTISNTYKVGS